MTSNTSPAIEAPPNPPSGKQPLHLTDLPRELQKEIISHVPQLDLISVAVVSRHFRDLASAELYRSFHILFPDEDDPAYANPVGGLASRLDTFATSDYDYAKYVREVSLDTVSASDKAELSYKQYLANQSCGKFMNTLFLIALRRAKSLEKFKYVASDLLLLLAMLCARPLTATFWKTQMGHSRRAQQTSVQGPPPDRDTCVPASSPPSWPVPIRTSFALASLLVIPVSAPLSRESRFPRPHCANKCPSLWVFVASRERPRNFQQ